MHVLFRDPLCAFIVNGTRCARLATAVHHIIDAVTWTAQGGDFCDIENLCGLCKEHHDAIRHMPFSVDVLALPWRGQVKACKTWAAQWKPVNFGTYGSAYEVSNMGQVRRIGRQTPLRGKPIQGTGYLQVELSLRMRAKRYKQSPPRPKRGDGVVRPYVHRLVALTFVPNRENKPYVNHIDGHKPNNRADNLEWVTMEENNAHATATGLNYAGRGKRAPYNTGARSPVCKASKARRGKGGPS
jgi:hypothetical protein